MLLQNGQERFLVYFDSKNGINNDSSEIIFANDTKSMDNCHKIFHNNLGAIDTQSLNSNL